MSHEMREQIKQEQEVLGRKALTEITWPYEHADRYHAALSAVLKLYLPTNKDDSSSSSGSYNLEGILENCQMEPDKFDNFVADLVRVLKTFHQYGRAAELMSIRDEKMKKMNQFEHVSNLGIYRQLFNEAMDAGFYREAMHVAERKGFQAHLQYFDSENAAMQEDLQDAIEKYAAELIAANQLTIESTDEKIRNLFLQTKLDLQTLFNRFLHEPKHKKKPKKKPVLASVPNGYESDTPSPAAIAVAKQLCLAYLQAGDFVNDQWALHIASQAKLDTREHEFYDHEILRRTNTFVRLTAWIKSILRN